MADTRHRTTLGNRFRFFVRLLGLTGVMAAAVGTTLILASPDRPAELSVESAREMLAGTKSPFLRQATLVVLGGLSAVAVWLVVELLGMLFLVTGRRAAAGGNNYLQVALAAALLVAVNVWSFGHYKRFDATRDRQFTLPEGVVNRLKDLDPSKTTDIVVLQLHKTAGSLSDKPDALDFAAERKVVEKVRDLVDQFREFGPQFRVSVLDVEEEGYDSRLEELTRTAPELRAAVDAAPENSIFFHADGKVQRLSFGEFYLLDKTASREAPKDAARGKPRITNLVLLPQGVEAFAAKAVALGEKRPKVGLLVIHPYLASRGTEEYDEFTAAGMRKALEANGFEVEDVILKKGWTGRSAPTPAADTFAEFEIDRLENLFNRLSVLTQVLDARLKQYTADKAVVDTAPLADIARQVRFLRFTRPIETEEDRRTASQSIGESLKDMQEPLRKRQEELDRVRPQYLEAVKDERAYEARRNTDVKAKLAAAVADCDVLVVPRMTATNLVLPNGFIPPSIYSLNQDQADVVRDFLKAGKPVLALFGPSNLAGRQPPPPGEADQLEKLFTRLGFEFGNLTVLHDAETRAMAERGDEALGGSGAVDVPPLVFDLPADGGKTANPVAAAFAVTAKAVDAKLDVKGNWFRPVYVDPAVAARVPFAATLAKTAADAWGEERPVPEPPDYVPEFTPPKPDDPKRGTRDEERKGPFPVAAAVEVPVPAEWLDPKVAAAQAAAAVGGGLVGVGGFAPLAADPADAKSRPTVRVAAFGNGGLFAGKRLEPAQEELLVHTLNWQLKRDDRLPKDAPAGEAWRYPRVPLTDEQFSLWRWGTFLGLPLVAAYLGLVVLMVRNLR